MGTGTFACGSLIQMGYSHPRPSVCRCCCCCGDKLRGRHRNLTSSTQPSGTEGVANLAAHYEIPRLSRACYCPTRLAHHGSPVFISSPERGPVASASCSPGGSAHGPTSRNWSDLSDAARISRTNSSQKKGRGRAKPKNGTRRALARAEGQRQVPALNTTLH